MSQPCDREQIIAKVREAIEAELWRQGDEPGFGYIGTSYSREHALRIDGNVDLQELAEAAFDALVTAWGPPW